MNNNTIGMLADAERVLNSSVINPNVSAAKDPGLIVAPLNLRPDDRGWIHGFIVSLKGTYGFIQVDSPQNLFFCGNSVSAPFSIHNFQVGDPVEFRLGRNHKGFMAIHVRKVFALRAA